MTSQRLARIALLVGPALIVGTVLGGCAGSRGDAAASIPTPALAHENPSDTSSASLDEALSEAMGVVYDRAAGHLVLLVCEDISGVRLIDGQEQDGTPSERKDQDSMQMTVKVTPDGIKVEESTLWVGAGVC